LKKWKKKKKKVQTKRTKKLWGKQIPKNMWVNTTTIKTPEQKNSNGKTVVEKKKGGVWDKGNLLVQTKLPKGRGK